MKRHKHGIDYFIKNLGTIVGIVLIWRGIWHVLDQIDIAIIGDETHLITAIGGIVIGFLILYIPDRDLKEIEKL
ncbi:MAG: hypothetical protein ACK4SL_04045 [Candidatus Paceibacteria bacterium]